MLTAEQHELTRVDPSSATCTGTLARMIDFVHLLTQVAPAGYTILLLLQHGFAYDYWAESLLKAGDVIPPILLR